MITTLLEADFPYVEVSRLVAADRRTVDPAYQAHRWWARRPPALIRAALLAATLSSPDGEGELWRRYADPGQHLAGWTVLDAFIGGGTTLVESARLGAAVRGQDVDPMSVELNGHQADPPSAEDVASAGEGLAKHLESTLGHLWPGISDDSGPWVPLHYFSVARVRCASCGEEDLLYRSPVLARSIGKKGAVVRDAEVHAFCPECLGLHELGAGAIDFECCGRVRPLGVGTFAGGRFRCAGCGSRSSHEELLTGTAPRVLVALEETPDGPGRRRRRIRAPRPGDEAVAVPTISCAQLDVPLEVSADPRPVSYGMKTVRDLHTDRQLAYLHGAMTWIAANITDDRVARALRLAVSTSVTSNNRLCSYATDYGRLAPLFSVRAYSMPALAVELNPLHPTGGRGTLRAAVARVVSSCSSSVRRHVPGKLPVAKCLDLPRHADSTVLLRDSSDGVLSDPPADICLTDPPYFDYIAYDHLSQIFRAWLPLPDLGGRPVMPMGEDPAAAFSDLLGRALSNCRRSSRPGAVVAFTFKGGQEAWDAVAQALRKAELSVTGLWPILADPGMGHHSGVGNREYDMLVVTRHAAVCEAVADPYPVQEWLASLDGWRAVSESDCVGFSTASDALSPLRARPAQSG